MTYFRDEGHFDSVPWTVYFHLAVAFVGQVCVVSAIFWLIKVFLIHTEVKYIIFEKAKEFSILIFVLQIEG